MSNRRKGIKRILVLNQYTIATLLCLSFLLIIAVVYLSQIWVERGSLPPNSMTGPKEQYEIAKLAAEIRQVRSDTSGSLFWLKMIALFVTVGGAVGGYLIGQSHATTKRIDFENRKSVDAAYQAIILELSDKAALLRAAAAVKLGAILNSFPHEWNVSDERERQLVLLTKQVLAAALSIEKDPKVLKTLTIAVVLHKHLLRKHWRDEGVEPQARVYADVTGLDLSGARAGDAYWAKADFRYSDFYRADLSRASFRDSILESAQFREAKLLGAVFVNSDCNGANFELADLRGANLSGARLSKTNFDGAKVYDCNIRGAEFLDNPEAIVDVSESGDGSSTLKVSEWLEQN